MFVIYDTATGAIRYTLTGDPSSLNLTSIAAENAEVLEIPDTTQLYDIGSMIVFEGRVVVGVITSAKLQAVEHVNNVIGEKRKAFVTDLPGQQMIYLRKEEEARAWVADPGTPDIADYTLMGAEIGVTAATGDEIAQIWLNLSALWVGAAAYYENIRLSTINAINAAPTIAAIELILGAFDTATG